MTFTINSMQLHAENGTNLKTYPENTLKMVWMDTEREHDIGVGTDWPFRNL